MLSFIYESNITISPDFIVASTFLGYLVIFWVNNPQERRFIAVLIIIAFILSFFLIDSTLLIVILLTGSIYSMLLRYLNKDRIKYNNAEVDLG